MNKIGIFVVSALFFISCNRKVDAADIDKMNGYWEIEKVVFANGKSKDYKNNEMYGFFQIKNFVGIRKKVTPVVDGTFLVNLDAEKVSIKEGKGKYIIHYATFYSQWDEEIVSVSADEMVLKNENETEYHYKRAQPLNIIKNGKKAK